MAIDTAEAPKKQHRIPPPRGDKQPLKVNIFEFMQDCNAALGPLFPYLDAGAVVPAGALFKGEPGADFGQFFHYNTVDEIVITFGANGGLQATGQAFATARLHGVNSFLKDQSNPESYLLVTITQRQATGGRDQNEAIVFRCRKCHEVLLRFEYHATAPPPPKSKPDGDRFPGFTSQWGSMTAAEAFNASEKQRTCVKCGTVNEPFPLERWGWKQWVTNNQAVNQARRALLQTAAEQLAG